MSAWLMRWLCPVNSMSRPWWTMRSMIEAASLSSAKIVPHSRGLDVRGEDDAPSLVAAGDDLVEQSGAVDVEGHVAELVQDDQIGFGDVLEHGLEGSLALGAAQLKDELGGGQEAYVHAPVDRAHAQRGGQVGLAASGPARGTRGPGPCRRSPWGSSSSRAYPSGSFTFVKTVAVQRLGDGEPGAAQEPGALRGLAVAPVPCAAACRRPGAAWAWPRPAGRRWWLGR